jgi:hypothetical protein
MTTVRSALLVALFTAGAVVGAGAVEMGSSAADGPPTVIVGQRVEADFYGSLDDEIPFTVDLFNTDDRELTAVPVSIAGWPVDHAEPASLTPRSWTPVGLISIPDCDREPTAALELTVDGRPVEVELPSHAGGMLGYLLAEYCGTSQHLFVEPSVEASSVDDAGLQIEIRIPGHGHRRRGEIQVVAIRAEMAGVAVEADDLPVILSRDGALTLTTRWTVDNCGPATRSHVTPDVRLIGADGTEVNSWLGERGVAVLARYIAVECGP